MSKKEKVAVGVDLGGTNIKIGLVSQDGKIVRKTSIDTKAEQGPDVVISQMKKGIKEILSKNKKDIAGIGIGSPGVVTVKKGIVENPPNLAGWNRVRLGEAINKEFEHDVYVENDANAAALGEMIFGNGRKFNSFIMITLGTGVGGGIIINRKLYRGEFGAAGEIGHTTIDYKGDLCNCGSFGCIETFVGNSYLVKRVKKNLPEHPDSLIWEIIKNNLELLTPIVIQDAFEQGDEFAASIINDMGLHIGAALASVSNLLDISTFIVGGGVAGFGVPLFEAIGKTIRTRVLTPLRKRVKVLPAKLKNSAGIKGASALVFYKSENIL
jgi:glucokinase